MAWSQIDQLYVFSILWTRQCRNSWINLQSYLRHRIFQPLGSFLKMQIFRMQIPLQIRLFQILHLQTPRRRIQIRIRIWTCCWILELRHRHLIWKNYHQHRIRRSHRNGWSYLDCCSIWWIIRIGLARSCWRCWTCFLIRMEIRSLGRQFFRLLLDPQTQLIWIFFNFGRSWPIIRQWSLQILPRLFRSLVGFEILRNLSRWKNRKHRFGLRHCWFWNFFIGWISCRCPRYPWCCWITRRNLINWLLSYLNFT